MDQKKLFSYVNTVFLAVGGVLSGIYADALFLSSYPKTWLPYYFLAMPLAAILMNLFINGVLSRATPLKVFKISLAFTSTLLLLYWGLQTQLYIWPFILAIAVSTFRRLYFTIAWNAYASAFNILEFKNMAFKINLITSLSSIFCSMATPQIIHYLRSDGLFFISVASFFIASIYTMKLTPLADSPLSTTPTVQTTFLKDNFFRSVCGILLLGLIIDGVINYSFTAVLLGKYSQDEIASVLSVLSAVMFILTFLIQSFVPQKLMLRIGLLGIMLISPIVMALSGLVVSFWPAFYCILAFRTLYRILQSSFDQPAMEMLINPYPSSIRKMVSYYLKGYVDPIGRILAVPLIYIINAYFNLSMAGIITSVLSMFLLWNILQAKKGYQKTLHNALKERRYTPDLIFEHPETIKFIQAELFTALNQPEEPIISTALSFFEQDQLLRYLHIPACMDTLEALLTHPNPEIRYQAAFALKQSQAQEKIPALLTQLKQETNSLVGWEIVDALMQLQFKTTRVENLSWTQEAQPFQKALWLIALAEENPMKAKDTLAELHSTDDKIMVAKIEKYIAKPLNNEDYLLSLIEDTDTQVSIAAIQSVHKDSSIELAASLINALSSKTTAYYATGAIIRLGHPTLPLLLHHELNIQNHATIPIIQILASMDHPLALNKLIELSVSDKISIRLAVARAMRHGYRNRSIDTQTALLFYPVIQWQSQEIKQLSEYQVPEKNRALQQEIRVQLRINREIFLIWFGLLENHQMVSNIEQHIIQAEHTSEVSLAKAYDFLDSIASSPILRKCIATIGRVYEKNIPISQHTCSNPELVLLASLSIQPIQELSMNLMEKTAILRQVELFQNVPFDSLQVIASVTKVLDMAAEESIFQQGSPSDRMYCIVTGQVKIQKNGKILSILNAADYFGELGLLDDSTRAADAITLQSGALLYIEKHDFLRVLEDLPEIMRMVVKQMIKYLRVNTEYVD